MICEKFNINPNWLRYGEGEVFVEKKESLLQSLVREFELTLDEETLVAVLLDLPPEDPAGVVRYVKETAARFEEALADKIIDLKGNCAKKITPQADYESDFFVSEVIQMKLPNSYGFVVKLGKGRRKLTFSKIYEQWCKRKFRDVLVKAVYVVVYKNLSGLHNMRFAEIHKPFTSEELQTL